MARTTDVAILGAGFRGLWLATELKKLGWDVTWIQLHSPTENKTEGGFVFDDWPWQVGPQLTQSKIVQVAKTFIDDVIRPKAQDISVQILTPAGPLELSGGARDGSLRAFFKKSHSEV